MSTSYSCNMSQEGEPPTHNIAEATNQSLSSLQPKGKGMDKMGSLGIWKFSQENARKALAHMLIVDGLPFKFVECESFKHFIVNACPLFIIPSRWTVARDCYDLYTSERVKLKAYFKESNQRVCLTTHTWTSLQMINYICITAHYINENWELKKKIINFCPISSHKGEAIGKVVEKCLLEWGINKVFTITMDDASSNDVAISYLKRKFNNWGTSILEGKYIHMRCIAHIINLVVVDGLKDMSSSVTRVCSAVRHVRQSPSRFQKFNDCVEIEKIQSKKLLCLDVSTHWNSTYLMLDTAEKFERAFERFEKQDPYFKRELDEEGGFPSDGDWTNVRRLCTFLQHFYDLILRVSDSMYVTCNNYFDVITSINFLLQNSRSSNDFDLCIMADKMKEKYDKYWGDIDKMNMVIFIAPMLDPRQKLEYMEYALEQLYGGEKGDAMKKKVKSVVYAMFNEYKEMYAPQSVQTSDKSLTTNEKVGQPVHKLKMSMKLQFKKHKMEMGGGDNKSELDRYLSESTKDDDDENSKFDILGWWNLNCHRFPILSKMARDVLAVPISTVASGSAFSTGGCVLDAFRSSLTPKIIQSLICSQDWYRSSLDMSTFSIEEDFEALDQLEKDLSKLTTEATSSEI